MASKVGAVGDITRRAALGALGVGVVGVTAASWPRLTAADIPGRGDNSLSIVIQGTKADAAAREKLVADFNKVHPEIKVKVQAIQSVDWKDFFVKLLTMVAAGQSPDLVYVATEGTQLFAERLAEPLDRFVQRDASVLQEYFDDVHPSLVEAMMYKGSLYQLPLDWNAANMYFNTSALKKAGLELPPADWSHLDFRNMLSSMKQANGSDFTPYYWTNRLFGGVVPWLYVNDTSFLKETKASGGRW
ncbi:MAG: extracellular solute-binding protein, partial [Arthrobacter sp.]|nr:extracellular solute-binding protein [Arthrobacter sp.]